MRDETIAPSRYRTGQGDRAIPLALGILGSGAAPAALVASGPFLWPWGVAAAVLVAAGAAFSLRRWWMGRETVAWVDDELVFQRGRRIRTLDPASLTRIRVSPAEVRTRLEAGSERFWLSHRLVRVDDLLDRLRGLRPDLFEQPHDALTIRYSFASAALQVLLASGTAGAGWALWMWEPWVSAAFLVAALYALWRVLWFIPRRYQIRADELTVSYWLRKRVWHGATAVQEDAYAAGGAVFFRLQIRFGSRTVVLDEGQLLEPLRPHGGWVLSRLCAPPG